MNDQLDALVAAAAEALGIKDPDQLNILANLAKCCAIEGRIYENQELAGSIEDIVEIQYQDLLTTRCCTRC